MRVNRAGGERSRSGAGARALLVIAVLALVLTVIGITLANRLSRLEDARAVTERAARQIEVARETEPLEKAFAQAVQPLEAPYDIEKTMRVVHELDRAVRETKSIREYIELLGRQDFRRVAPRVLEARKGIVEVLVRYYAAVGEQEELDRFWSVFRDEVWNRVEVPRIERLKLVGIDLDFEKAVAPPKSAREREEEMRVLRDEARQRVVALQTELASAIERALPVFKDAEDEWKRLCLQRDRAYVEALGLHFDAARVSAEAALAMAPFDEEAQLLRALALVEGANANAETKLDVVALLDEILREHPDSAPALLLRGMWRVRNGELEAGRVDLKLAASRYPEQARVLATQLDPYRMRSYLQRSQQGVAITGLYRAMMLGASWFSPELQSARLEFDAGQIEHATQLVREHFARRRAQGQWDLILFDLRFCEDLLGEHYGAIFPEHSYLDLHVSRNFFGKDYAVSVDNRSDKSLHNAALVLCVRFTDMQLDDYVTYSVGPTRPILPAVMRTPFDDLDVRLPWGASEKGPGDVVPPLRAILVADEAVFWVDAIEFKDETVKRFSDLPDARELGATNTTLPERWQRALDALKTGDVSVELVENTFTKNDLRIELPREVALLGPLFTLRIGERVFDEGQDGGVRNRLENDRVRLLFASAGAELADKPERLELTARSTLGRVEIVFARGDDGAYRVASVD